MPSHSRAGFTIALGSAIAALLAASLAAPAQAAPTDHSTKIQLGDAANKSRVVEGRYLVQTEGTPLTRGGSQRANSLSQAAARSAAKTAGASVESSYSDLWTGIAVTATENQIEQLARSSAVTAIYPVLRVPMPTTTVTKTTVSSELTTIAAAGTASTGSGIKVGVIDTGLDYNNPDLGGAGVNDQTADFKTSGGRVQYGYDFVGDDYNADDDYSIPVEDGYPDDCNGHGTHVAGIVGADGSGDGDSATGVAPAVTFGAYRVFGCQGSTDTEIILQALTRAKTDGMNVVNLSIGSTFDSWPSYPDAVAAANLVKAGIVVVAAAGNDGDLGLFAAGSPAVGSGVISVASYETERIRSRAIGVGEDKIAYQPIEGTGSAPADNASTLQLRLASNITACTLPETVPAGTALLVKRGTCTFADKVGFADAAGAQAVVIYNDQAGLDSFSTNGPTWDLPGVSISGTAGADLAGRITDAGPLSMTWLGYQQDVLNPDGGTVSSFSSAGLAADLSLVPTITAPGGKIYSTVPVEQGGHANMSGTSMAAPFVTGSIAVLLQAQPALKKNPAAIAQRLYNSADPILKTTRAGLTNRAEAVFRQGSGLIDLSGALAPVATVSPALLKLGEGNKHTVTITLTNKTGSTQTYLPRVATGLSAAASTGTGTGVGTTTPGYAYGAVGFKAPAKVTVKAGKSAKVKLTITAPASILRGRAGMLYGGWVEFRTRSTGQTISVPFAGVRGDYQSVKLLNGFRPVINEAGDTWRLPALGWVDEDTDLQPEYAAGRSYTMDYWAYDVPLVLYHLDYPASDVRLKVINTKTKKSYYAVIDWNHITTANPAKTAVARSTHLGRLSRDDLLYYLEFDGAYQNAKGKLAWVPSGTYQLQLRVLKPLGSASKSSHWETFTTPSFKIRW